MRIDDADTIDSHEPQFSVRGLSDMWGIAAGERTAPDAVGTVENRRMDGPRGILSPRVQLGPGNAHQAAGHVQPESMVVGFRHPVNRIAGQSVSAGKRGNMTVFHPA